MEIVCGQHVEITPKGVPLAEMKAITLMRYIRKALEDKTFMKAA